MKIEATVAALTETIIAEQCPVATDRGDDRRTAARALAAAGHFLAQQQAQMPGHLRLPLHALTLLFALWPVPVTGQSFSRLPLARRQRQLRAWRRSRLGFRRNLVKFYEVLAVFGYYAEIYGEDYRTSAGGRTDG